MDDAMFNGAGDTFDDVPFGVLDADAAAELEVAEGQIALLKQVRISPIPVHDMTFKCASRAK